jgi:hypothetical protein
MNKGMVIILIGLTVFVLAFGNYFLHLNNVDDEYFHPGDAVSMRVPSTGTIYKLIVEPTFVRYYLKNPEGEIVHTEDHTVTYKQHEFLGWSFYDEHQVTIGAFPMEGIWTLEGEPYSKLGIIELGSPLPETKTFYVADNVLCSLFAPLYFYGTHPLSVIFGGINIVLPAPIYLVALAVALIMLVFVSKYMRDAKTARMIAEHERKRKSYRG